MKVAIISDIHRNHDSNIAFIDNELTELKINWLKNLSMSYIILLG